MASKEFKVKIEGQEYFCVGYGASEGLEIQVGLIKKFSGVLGPALSCFASKSNEDESVQIGLLSSALKTLDPCDFVQTVKEILKHTKRNGETVASIFDSAYQANYGEMYLAIIFTLKSNYGSLTDFFPNAATLLKDLSQKNKG